VTPTSFDYVQKFGMKEPTTAVDKVLESIGGLPKKPTMTITWPNFV
jgi:hypothetical protein